MKRQKLSQMNGKKFLEAEYVKNSRRIFDDLIDEEKDIIGEVVKKKTKSK